MIETVVVDGGSPICYYKVKQRLSKIRAYILRIKADLLQMKTIIKNRCTKTLCKHYLGVVNGMH